MENKKFTLMIHGGAGAVFDTSAYRPSLKTILEAGKEILKSGGAALDAVEKCVRMLEDNPLFNAGKGSVLNSEGEFEMDAAIMSGRDISAGAVAGVVNVKNPISLARKVMEKSGHVMLVGNGAMKFAKEVNAQVEGREYFLTEKRLKQWQEAKESEKVMLDHSDGAGNKKFGTVGAVAIDNEGNLAAATSTGGITNKKYGRVGDSPIVGAGVFADNESCAVSATGIGEQFIRTVFAKSLAEFMKEGKLSAEEAAKKGIEYLVRRVSGIGGAIVVGRDYSHGVAFSSQGMIYGYVSDHEDIWTS